MKLLLDENVPNSYKEKLEKFDYKDIERINDFGKGMTDREVFNLALKEERVIVTIDKDFHEWKKEKHFGIISLSGKLKEPVEKMLQAIKQVKKDDRFKNTKNLDDIFMRVTTMDFVVGRKIKSRYKEVSCKYDSMSIVGVENL